ncbi:e7f4ad3f-b1e0-4a5c-b38e-57b92a8d55aa [Sclerotinia trifoliorum]|uniref:E7f4ad3f-b1e0-4a5c-b38e-57b92a8d55aa n=1 Tax=Sclerotinia trifoliorum TaxID=28548 RepID=A0A8H2VU37_9HELO|nr:e7f4ad3f-b1e0-4a5c-b38e-57b92a8d55aa [Sclerotinia trifoliorum]
MENESTGTRESRKRSHLEMSQSHLRLSSSPVLFRERPSNFDNSPPILAPLANIPTASSSSRERRFRTERGRTPISHNPSDQSSRHSRSFRVSREMEANSTPPPRPRSIVSSGIIIDLTSDQDDNPSPPALNRRAAPIHAPSPRPSPTLGRSEARLEQVVDLTADDDDDDDEDDTIIITHSRERSIPLPPRSRLPQPPSITPSFGQGTRLHTIRGSFLIGNQMGPARPPPERHLPIGERAIGGMRALYENGADIIMDIHNLMGLNRDELVGLPFLGGYPAMPNGMDYGRVALQENKPEHVPPPPVGYGFTRSPTENDTAICPSCEEELIHKKDGDEPLAKKSRGAPSRKDREEHPFWVVKDCGHVFCNKCYQHRSNEKISSFRGSKNMLCSVEDCESVVKNKDKWVGIFL